MRLTLIAAFIAVPAVALAQSSNDRSKAQALAQTDSLFAAAGRADLTKVLTLFDDAGHASSGALVSKADLKTTHEPMYAAMQRIEFRVGRTEATVLGPNVVMVLAAASVQGIPRNGPPGRTDQAAWTLIWHRVKGHWSVLHMHQSTAPPQEATPAR